MTCRRKEDFLDPAGEVNDPWADPRILVGGGLRVGPL
jgi:hypothetical protein